MINDRRRFNRVCFESPAVIKVGDCTYESTVIDLSLKGALIIRPKNLLIHIGDNIRIEIKLADDVYICMNCSVVYENNDKIGMSCNNIDIDSITHLKRLVELNTPDSESLLERDLENFIDL